MCETVVDEVTDVNVVSSSGRCRRNQLRQAKKKNPFYKLLRTKKRRSKRKRS